MKNPIINALLEIAGENYREYIGDSILNPGENTCSLPKDRGGVYGVAIYLSSKKSVELFFNKAKESRNNLRIKNVDEWKPIATNVYPLYWGKDSNLGFRLFEHTRNVKTSRSIQLCDPLFLGQKVIFGAIFCNDNLETERKLHSVYTDLLKNAKTK